MKFIIKMLVLIVMAAQTNAQVPADWVQHTVEDAISMPIEKYWELSFKLNLEEIGSAGDYKDLPKIKSTTPVNGNFTKAGHSRRVHFDNGKTLLETIISLQSPHDFAYELTEIELPLKNVAKRARGHFRYSALPDGNTKVVWTYGFDQRNFIFKWFIKRYIKTTHRFWMRDTLVEMKRQGEKMYKEER